MSINDYALLTQLDTDVNELSQILKLNTFNIQKSINSKTSFFTCERLMQLYSFLNLNCDNRKFKVSNHINKAFNYPVSPYFYESIEEFIEHERFEYGILILGIPNSFTASILSSKNSKIGVLANKCDFLETENIEIAIINELLLLPINYFLYSNNQLTDIRLVLNINKIIYKVNQEDSLYLTTALNDL